MRKTNGRRGFTLIELMLVVGIIGAIAAIAIPNFIKYQARSRRSEAFTNLSAMARAQKAFLAERNYFHDSVLASGINSDVPDITNYGGAWGTMKMPWDGDAATASKLELPLESMAGGSPQIPSLHQASPPPTTSGGTKRRI